MQIYNIFLKRKYFTIFLTESGFYLKVDVCLNGNNLNPRGRFLGGTIYMLSNKTVKEIETYFVILKKSCIFEI